MPSKPKPVCRVEWCGVGSLFRGLCDVHYNLWLKGDKSLPALPCHKDFTPEEWFWLGVDKSGGEDACWPWTRYRAKPMGYGRCPQGWTHRYALELTLGRPITPGMEAAHSCDNPPCCNPRHLREATRVDNTGDAADRARMPWGEANNRAKLTLEAVRHIRASNDSPATLAYLYGISAAHVLRIQTRKAWRHAA